MTDCACNVEIIIKCYSIQWAMGKLEFQIQVIWNANPAIFLDLAFEIMFASLSCVMACRKMISRPPCKPSTI